MLTEAVRQHREKVVRDHFRDEIEQQWDDVLSTFPHPRYEIIPTMTIHDGNTEVRGYYHDSRVAFPDQRSEMIALRHCDDAVVTEFYLLGTHLGPLGGIPATGSTFKVRMTAFFVFDDETLVCERIYFDSLTMLKQLLRGLNFKKPSSWLLLLRALRGARTISSGGAPIPDGLQAA